MNCVNNKDTRTMPMAVMSGTEQKRIKENDSN